MKLGCLGFQKNIDKATGKLKGWFVYMVSKIPDDAGSGNRLYCPKGWTSIYVKPEVFDKINLKAGAKYEVFGTNGYVDWDSLKEI